MTASLHPQFSSFQSNLLRGLWATSAVFSIAGSLLLCFHVTVGRRRSGPLHRLLLGLSVSDRFVVFPLAFYPIEEPSAACTANGFLAVLGFAGPYYNAALSLYYLLTIRHNVRDQRISKVYEPAFHGVAILYAATSAFVGLPLQVYNPSADGLGCFVGPHPLKCNTSTVECQRGEAAELYSLLAVVLPLFLVLISLIVNNLLLYCFIRKTERQSRSYIFPGSNNKNASSITNPTSNLTRPGQPEEGQQLQEELTTSQPIWCGCGNKFYSTNNISQKVATQSFLYVAAFFLSYIFSLILLVLSAVDPDGLETGKYYVWSALEGIFHPSQGIFNCLAYLRPRYLRYRSQDNLSRWQSFRLAVLLEKYTQSQNSSKPRNRSSSKNKIKNNSNNSGNYDTNTNHSAKDSTNQPVLSGNHQRDIHVPECQSTSEKKQETSVSFHEHDARRIKSCWTKATV